MKFEVKSRNRYYYHGQREFETLLVEESTPKLAAMAYVKYFSGIDRFAGREIHVEYTLQVPQKVTSRPIWNFFRKLHRIEIKEVTTVYIFPVILTLEGHFLGEPTAIYLEDDDEEGE